MKALDLFCGAGGASMGLCEAGFEVTGIDSNPKLSLHYCPHPNAGFVCDDVMNLPEWFIGQYDFVWASPPCQRYSVATKQHNPETHPDLVPPTREMLDAVGVPYVLENVPGAPLRRDLMLCGLMVGLPLLRRHRVFECSGFTPAQPDHPQHTGRYITVAGHPGGKSTRDGTQGYGSTDEWRQAMGIDWMTGKQLAEAIPPAYSRYIAQEFLK